MTDGVDEVCDRCKKDITISVKYFEQAMKDGDPLLCQECYGKLLDEQTEVMPKRCFEYMTIHHPVDDSEHNKNGAEGWELVSVDNGMAYFKREYIKEG